MIYFLHGPDTYRSRKRLGEIIAEFEKKTGAGFSISRIDAEDSPSAVLSAGRTASLFSSKELVVIENISQVGDREQAYARERLPDWKADTDLTVIFWEGDCEDDDFFKALKKAAFKVQEFKFLAPAVLSRWIEQEIAERGMKLSPAEKALLVSASGGDLWSITNELDKIRAGWSLARESSIEENVFGFTDAFLSQRRKAFLPLERLLWAGNEPIYLTSMLASSFRSLALVWWGTATGKMESATKSMHPFVVKKNSEVAKRFDAAKLQDAYRDLIEADVGLKTGRLPSPYPLVELVLSRLDG